MILYGSDYIADILPIEGNSSPMPILEENVGESRTVLPKTRSSSLFGSLKRGKIRVNVVKNMNFMISIKKTVKEIKYENITYMDK